jgi:acetyl esterase/lipase
MIMQRRLAYHRCWTVGIGLSVSLLSWSFTTSCVATGGTPGSSAASTDTTSGARELAAMPLWSGGAPGARGDSAEDRPSVTPFLPQPGRGTGTAAVIFPGGGYQHLAFDHEGVQVARWLASLGVAGFVVRYRLGPRYQQPTMLQDGLRAVRLVRAHAADWGVMPQRIGVVGFSAGGHMASTVGTHFDTGMLPSADVVERVSSRPDFMVLLYPVITMTDPFVHRGSRTNLLGAQPSAELVSRFSNETQVTRSTPPTFIVTSTDDRTVPVENSLRFYEALKADSVPVELHVFERGRHGFGLAPTDPALSIWPRLCETWMRQHGWLAAPQR